MNISKIIEKILPVFTHVFAFFIGRSQGKKSERLKALNDNNKTNKEIDEIDNKIDSMSTGDLSGMR